MMKQTGPSGVAAGLCRVGGYFCGVSLAVLAAAGPAIAQEESPSKASCAQAYESAQESRAAGQLQETQKRLSVCARPECPSFVQKDCARWLEEVERELPSVVVSAPGLDAEGAQQMTLQVDGKPVTDPLGGAALPLDPGRHELVAEAPGQPPLTRVIMAQQGVQNRPVTLDFADATKTPAPSATPVDVGAEGPTLRPYAYVAWGVGAVGFGMFAVLGTLGRADEQALQDDCPNITTDPALVNPGAGVCLKSTADERKADYEREFVLADVGLVTGIVGLAAGTALFIVSAAEGSSTDSASSRGHDLRVDVKPTTGGAFASVGGAF
jgi:hypothetical protein